mgnify:CR=1 FL=1
MQSVEVNGLIFDEYLSAEKIAEIVGNVAERINNDYAGKEPLFICVLNGAFMYASDLFKCITLPSEITFVRLKSYEGTSTTGEVKILTPLSVDIQGRDVIVIEDIIDTGNTLSYLIEHLKEKEPNSIKLCALLDKPERRETEVFVDYVGFTIPNEFVVGYGLDADNYYRCLPYVGYFKKKTLTKK